MQITLDDIATIFKKLFWHLLILPNGMRIHAFTKEQRMEIAKLCNIKSDFMLNIQVGILYYILQFKHVKIYFVHIHTI